MALAEAQTELTVVERERGIPRKGSSAGLSGAQWSHVDPIMDRDPSHPGKLTVFKNTVNRACHDNTPPGNAEMTQACGDIRFLVKNYLGR